MSEKKSLFRFDSVDAALTRVQLVVIGIGLVVLGLVLPGIGAFSRPFLGVSLPGNHVESGVPDVDVTEVFARFEAGVGLRLASLLPGLVVVAVGLCVVWCVYGLVADFAAPFVERSLTRLRLLGWVLLFGPLVYMVVDGFVTAALMRAAFDDDGLFYLESGVAMVFVGIGLVVTLIAEAYARGVKLEGDVEGLI